MNEKFKLFQYFGISRMVNRTLDNEVGVLSQLLSILAFYSYHSGIFITIFNLKSDGVYFTNFAHADIIFFFIGVITIFFFSRLRGIKNLVGLLINSFIPCYIWSWIVFAVYTLITVPISFYCEQNLYGNPSPYFKGVGFVIVQLLPFALLLHSVNKLAKK